MNMLLGCEYFSFFKFQNSDFENSWPYGRKIIEKKNLDFCLNYCLITNKN